MNPSPRVCKRRVPPETVLRRRSSRIRSRQCPISIPHESQGPLEQRQRDSRTLEPFGATLASLPTVDATEASIRALRRQQLQEYPRPLNPASVVRKRRSDEPVETSAERPIKLPRLTKKNLEVFERMAGTRKDPKRKPSNSSRSEARLRASAPSELSSKVSDASAKTVSSTDSRFPAHILKNGIYEPPNSKRPANLEQLQGQLDRARETASPTESEYELTAYKIQTAENEQTLLLETSTLLKGYGRGYRRVFNQAFNDFPKNEGFNDGLSPAQPDMVEGLDLASFGSFPIRDESLLRASVPSSGSNAITLPHLAGEWKGPGKDMNLARHQAAYDGACMVYSRNEALSFLNTPDPAGHAYVSTFTTDGTTLHTFAHYSSQSNGQLTYHQYPTSSSLLTSSYEDFKKSRRRVRNLQDGAKEASEELRDKLREERASFTPHIPAQATSSASCESDNEEGPSGQLLTEYWTSFSANNENDYFADAPVAHNIHDPPPPPSFWEHGQELSSSAYIPAVDSSNLNTSIDDPPLPLISPPQSSEGTSLPYELEDIENPNQRASRKSRRTRLVERSSEADHNPKSRKARRNH